MANDHTPTVPRGIRNNNPGNVRSNPCVLWEGQNGQDDAGFITFIKPVYGIRCMAKVLRHYRDYNHLQTVSEIINRWAPPLSNDTHRYVKDVSKRMNITPGKPIDWATEAIPLIRAIIWHENGEQPYPARLLEKGLQLSHRE